MERLDAVWIMLFLVGSAAIVALTFTLGEITALWL
jgi:hypothetical protein